MGSTLEQIESWGVVGAGGAGFPTHVKLNAQADTIILNAAECEPLLHKDKELLKAYGTEILDGLEQARQLVGATDSVVGIKGKYTDVIDDLSAKLTGSSGGGGTRIVELTDSYPAGDEFILVYDVTKRIIKPGGIPLHVGCVVINVETALNIALAKPVTSKFLTIAGAVNQPATIEVPVGTSFAEAVELAGGANVPEPVALIGGAMMGKFCDDFSQPITKTSGGMIVLNRDHPLVHRYTLPWDAIKRIGASACDQCNFCTFYCPRYLLGHPIEPHAAMRSLGFNMVGEANVVGTEFCCECNLCTMMACPEDLDPKNVCTTNKRELAAAGKKWDIEADPHRAEMHLDNRRVPIPRLIRKIGLADFDNRGPLRTNGFKPSRVVLPLKQHIGAPAQPTVAQGAAVRVGDLIAKPPADAMGSPIHASIDGRVTDINENIVIES